MKPAIKTLPISKLRQNGGTQMRGGLNTAVIDEYKEIYSEGGTMPPVKAMYDGKEYWLYDGFTRCDARLRAGLADVKVEVTSGSQRDAILAATGANSDHGLPRTQQDKRRAVETLLNDAEWSKNSDRWIADQAKVSNHLVAKVRAELQPAKTTGNIPSCEPRKGKDGKERAAPKAAEKPASDTPEVSTKQQEVRDFFKDKSDYQQPIKQHNVSFDTEQLEKEPSPSIVKDAGGRNVPDHLQQKQAGSALILSAATKVERLRTEINDLSGQPGVEFLEPHIANLLGDLQKLKDGLRDCMFAAECPVCQRQVKATCTRCKGHGFIPTHVYGQLSKAEMAYLEGLK